MIAAKGGTGGYIFEGCFGGLFVCRVARLCWPLRTPARPTIGSDLLFHLGVFLAAVCFSIPAVILFAFGQMVGELRSIRHYSRQQAEHLKAMRAYYEPHGG